MKKYLLIIFVIASGAKQSYGQTNVYHPFPDSNAVWNEYWGTNSGYGYYMESIIGDTVINSIKYHKVYKHTENLNFPHSDTIITISNSSFIGAIREDSLKRVYFYNKGGVIQNSASPDSIYLLYDFSKQVGDTIKFTTPHYGYAFPFLVVDSIDSVLINSQYRKRFHLSCYSPIETWIEGIGSIRSLFSIIVQYPTCYCTNELVCYKYDNINYYLNPKVADCFVYWRISIDNINELQQQEIYSITPNPFSTQTLLQTNKNLQNATIIIYNSFGQEVKQMKNISGQSITLQRDDLPSGLYCIRLMQDNKTFTTSKLIISDK